MFRPALIFVLAFASLQLNAQFRSNRSELRNGFYRQKYADMEVTGTVINHQFQGTFITKSLCRDPEKLHPAWVITLIRTYNAGIEHGPYISFDCNGDTSQVGNYNKGRKCGMWRTKQGKKLVSICNYDQYGLFSGWQLYFNSDGNIYRREFYHDENRWISWYYSPEGRLTDVGENSKQGKEGTWYQYSNEPRLTAQDTFPIMITNWEHGVQLGTFQKFTKGVMTEEYEVVNGAIYGKHRLFRNGKLWVEETRIGNQLHGAYTVYAFNGNIYQSANYAYDALDGVCSYYDTITKQRTWFTEYEHGKVIREQKRTSDGKLIYNKVLLNEDSLYYSFEAFYPNGVMKERGYLYDKSVTGIFESWHDNGRRKVKSKVVNGQWEEFIYIWNAEGVQVYSASVHQGIACDDETVRSDKGVLLKRGAKEYKEQVERYRPYGLFTFEDNGCLLPQVVIAKRYTYLRNAIAQPADTTHPVSCISENSPQFPGGEAARVKYFQENIMYPAMELESGIQGTTYVSFVVRSDSTITDVRTLRPVPGSTMCSKEVERVVKRMPKWIPAKQNGKAVEQKCVMSVKFQII